MAAIKHLSSGKSYTLTSPYVVGRSSASALCLSSRLVTSEHASLRWINDGWEMRDLGSRNGTFIDDHKLQPAERVRVKVGSRIAFGDPEDVFEMTSDSAPIAAHADDGAALEANGRELYMPEVDDPELVVHERNGLWFIEDMATGESRRAKNGQEVQVAGRAWRLSLPTSEEATWQLEKPREMELVFEVSANEEHIAITALQEGEKIELPNRSHSYLLLVLARARLEDAESASLPDKDRGWMYMADLTSMLKTSANQIGSLIFRARKQFQKAGLAGADTIVESRPGTGQRRLGISRIVIRS